MEMRRDISIDVIRGLAVFLMIQGNIAGSLASHPYPAWGKFYVALGSFVPALFVLVAGMMVVLTSEKHRGDSMYFVVRGIAVMCVGAFVIDALIFKIVPFIGMDVLYLIGLSIPIAYGFQSLSSRLRWMIVAGIFLITPALQSILGYTPDPTAFSLSSLQNLAIPSWTSIMQFLFIVGQYWVIDGWFPVFPWLGFALLGVNLGILRWRDKTLTTFAQKKVVIGAFALLLAGLALWTFQIDDLFIRDGFSEMIYPPTLAYCATAIAQIVLIFAFIDWRPEARIYRPLIVFGQSALFVYVLHWGIIALLPPEPPLPQLLATLITTIVFLLGLAYVLRHVREIWPQRPALVQYLGI
jgi:uncharacterized membrane protein